MAIKSQPYVYNNDNRTCDRMSRLDIRSDISQSFSGESESDIYAEVDRDIERASRLDPASLGLSFVRESRPTNKVGGYAGTKGKGNFRRPKPDGVGLTDDAGPNARHVAKGGTGGSGVDGDVKETPKPRPKPRVKPDGRSGKGDIDREPESVQPSQHDGDRSGDVEPPAITPEIDRRPVGEIPKHSAPQQRIPDFERAVFDAMVDEIKFNNVGNLIVRMIVPYRSDITEALKLKDSFGIMLTGGWYRKSYIRNNPETI